MSAIKFRWACCHPLGKQYDHYPVLICFHKSLPAGLFSEFLPTCQCSCYYSSVEISAASKLSLYQVVFIALSRNHLLYTTLFFLPMWNVADACKTKPTIRCFYNNGVCHSNYTYTYVPSGQVLSVKNKLQMKCHYFLNNYFLYTLRANVIISSECTLSRVVVNKLIFKWKNTKT